VAIILWEQMRPQSGMQARREEQYGLCQGPSRNR
jgi:hypothetical protein